MAVDEKSLQEEAGKLLNDNESPEALPGMDADTKVSILNTSLSTSQDFVLGERVEIRVIGTVNFKGDEIIENEGKRKVVKIKSDTIEFTS